MIDDLDLSSVSSTALPQGAIQSNRILWWQWQIHYHLSPLFKLFRVQRNVFLYRENNDPAPPSLQYQSFSFITPQTSHHRWLLPLLSPPLFTPPQMMRCLSSCFQLSEAVAHLGAEILYSQSEKVKLGSVGEVRVWVCTKKCLCSGVSKHNIASRGAV